MGARRPQPTGAVCTPAALHVLGGVAGKQPEEEDCLLFPVEQRKAPQEQYPWHQLQPPFPRPYKTHLPDMGQLPRDWKWGPDFQPERVAWHQYHALHGVCQLRGQLTMPPPRPTGAAHALHSGTGMVHKAAPTSCTTEPHGLCPPQSSRVYRAPERTSRRDGSVSQETSHRRAVRTWDRPRSYHTGSWAVKYLDQCLCPTAADLGAQQVASAMQYLAQP